MTGSLIVAAGYGLNIVLMDEVWQFVLVSCVVSAGIGFTFGAMPALIMGAVPAAETSAANSLNTFMRSIGTSSASAVAAVILSQMTTTGRLRLPAIGEQLQDGHGRRRRPPACALASFLPRHRRAPASAVDTAADQRHQRADRGGALRRQRGPVADAAMIVTDVRGDVLANNQNCEFFCGPGWLLPVSATMSGRHLGGTAAPATGRQQECVPVVQLQVHHQPAHVN